MTYTDTHAHLTDPALASQINAVLERAEQAGVSKIICVGTTAESSRESIKLAEEYPQIYASVGIHPNYSHQASESDWQSVLSLVEHEKVVALGETGLDRYWDDAPWERSSPIFIGIGN